MAQLDQQSATLIDRLGDQDTSINDLAKTVARGVPAMRDASENVLELNPGATYPLLTSRPNDVGTGFLGGWFYVVDRTGQQYRDMIGKSIQLSSSAVDETTAGTTRLDATGIVTPSMSSTNVLADNGIYGTFTQTYDVNTERVRAGNSYMDTNGYWGRGLTIQGSATLTGNIDIGTLSCDASTINSGGFAGPTASFGGVVINGGGINVGNRGIHFGGHIDGSSHGSGASGFNGGGFSGPEGRFGGVIINGGGVNAFNKVVDVGFGWVYAGTYFQNISEARFKRDISPVEESQLDIVRNAPLYHYRYRPDAAVVSPHANGGDQEAATAAADAWRVGPMADDLPDRLLGDLPHGKAPDLTGMLHAAWGAIRELSTKLDAALDRVAALEAAP